jgi:hypothetical protein
LSEKKVDHESFRIGRFAGSATAWSEAARSEAKDMSLSSPFDPEDYDSLLPYVEKATEKNQVGFHLEKTLMTTDLFAEIDMGDKWVFIIYKKERVLADYKALKVKKKHLEKEGKYMGENRKNIARSMGKLLGYSNGYIEERIKRIA